MQFTIRPEQPVSKQLENKILAEIQLGRLREGEKMPASRDLAEFYQWNRKTIRKAYENLTAQGWLVTKQGKGTFVTVKYPLLAEAPGIARAIEVFNGNIEFREPKPETWQKTQEYSEKGLPSAVSDDFLFNKYLAAYKRSHFSKKWTNPEAAVNELKANISNMLKQYRNIHNSINEISMFHGSYAALNSLSSQVLQPGDTVAAIAPLSAAVKQIFNRNAIEFIELSASSFVPELVSLVATTRVSAVYIDAYSYMLSGNILNDKQKYQLTALAARHDFYLIESDYFHEFWYTANRSLSSISRNKTIYISSVSLLLPQLNSISFVVAPAETTEKLKATAMQSDLGEPNQLQAVSELIKTGLIINRAGKMFSLLKEKREAMATLLRKHLSPQFNWTEPPCGFQYHIAAPGSSKEELFNAMNDKHLTNPNKNICLSICDTPPGVLINVGLVETRTMSPLVTEIASLLKKKKIISPQ